MLSRLRFVDIEAAGYQSVVSEICISDIWGNVLLSSDKAVTSYYDDLVSITNDRVVIAFDYRQDVAFLANTLALYEMPMPTIAWLCGKEFSEAALGVRQLSLKTTCRLLKLRFPNHTARADCLALARVVRKLLRKLLMEKPIHPALKQFILSAVFAADVAGIDNLPIGDNMTMEYLYNEILQETKVGRQYLEIFRQSLLQEMQDRQVFNPNIIALLENESYDDPVEKAVRDLQKSGELPDKIL